MATPKQIIEKRAPRDYQTSLARLDGLIELAEGEFVAVDEEDAEVLYRRNSAVACLVLHWLFMETRVGHPNPVTNDGGAGPTQRGYAAGSSSTNDDDLILSSWGKEVLRHRHWMSLLPPLVVEEEEEA